MASHAYAAENSSAASVTFTDLTKVFDTVSKSGLQKLISKFDCPDKFINLVSSNGVMPIGVYDDVVSS